MSDFLYYCSKCNSLVADTYEEDDLACEKCGARMIPMHIDEDEWNEMTSDEKKELIMSFRRPQPQVQRRRPVAQTGSYDTRAVEGQRNPRASRQQQQRSNKPQIQDYYGRFSPMSIGAFVCSFFSCVGIVGIVLGIIDLTKNDGRKRGLSIAAIVIGIIMTLGTIVGALGNNSEKKDNTPPVESVDSSIEESSAVNEDTTKESTESTTPEDELIIDIVGDNLGEYGKIVVINKGTEFEDSHNVYNVPIGTYEVTNKGEHPTQVNVYPDEVTVNEDGWEEFNGGYVEVLNVGESKEMTVDNGYHFDIDSPEHIVLKKIDGKSNGDVSTSTTTTQEPEVSEEEFKASCQEFNYKQIARNPEEYVGKNFKVDVKVFATDSGGLFDNFEKYYKAFTKTELDTGGLDIKMDDLYMDDMIFVIDCQDKNSPSYLKVLDDDVITVYGTFQGMAATKNNLTKDESETVALYMKYAELISE